ncbi:hypothetical protein ERO13_D11G275725v2 [Gossypium hirsutum]|uniref:Uncharacterized protein n=3 Tax=Gossypium TaxID=3633 RepID=A0A5J5PHB6_GOSBA|nr:hypothetical protein ES319_D11G301100v1 [Gossypium barbadense]KAG4122589.1 hypothetical protein ERO13_D11G275725v2 [Gossypium hirsutum]TYG47200.1 hypothetical protein ES288_D11G319100v1 [Gossypium darwinii]TYH46238.1 hypothetical protein ES332_D11G321600v1 [Gossypium tomentosum]
MIISMLILLLGRRSSEEGSTLVEGILTLHDSSRVYKVPISLQTRPDQSMCHWPSNGIYSVKSSIGTRRNLFLDEHSLTQVMQFHRRLVRVGLALVSLNVSLTLLLLFRTRDARVLLLRYGT